MRRRIAARNWRSRAREARSSSRLAQEVPIARHCTGGDLRGGSPPPPRVCAGARRVLRIGPDRNHPESHAAQSTPPPTATNSPPEPVALPHGANVSGQALTTVPKWAELRSSCNVSSGQVVGSDWNEHNGEGRRHRFGAPRGDRHPGRRKPTRDQATAGGCGLRSVVGAAAYRGGSGRCREPGDVVQRIHLGGDRREWRVARRHGDTGSGEWRRDVQDLRSAAVRHRRSP